MKCDFPLMPVMYNVEFPFCVSFNIKDYHISYNSRKYINHYKVLLQVAGHVIVAMQLFFLQIICKILFKLRHFSLPFCPSNPPMYFTFLSFKYKFYFSSLYYFLHIYIFVYTQISLNTSCEVLIMILAFLFSEIILWSWIIN